MYWLKPLLSHKVLAIIEKSVVQCLVTKPGQTKTKCYNKHLFCIPTLGMYYKCYEQQMDAPKVLQMVAALLQCRPICRSGWIRADLLTPYICQDFTFCIIVRVALLHFRVLQSVQNILTVLFKYYPNPKVFYFSLVRFFFDFLFCRPIKKICKYLANWEKYIVFFFLYHFSLHQEPWFYCVHRLL